MPLSLILSIILSHALMLKTFLISNVTTYIYFAEVYSFIITNCSTAYTVHLFFRNPNFLLEKFSFPTISFTNRCFIKISYSLPHTTADILSYRFTGLGVGVVFLSRLIWSRVLSISPKTPALSTAFPVTYRTFYSISCSVHFYILCCLRKIS